MKKSNSIAILGAGNIGCAIALGLIESKRFRAGEILLTRRQTRLLEPFRRRGCIVMTDNAAAVRKSGVFSVSLDEMLVTVREVISVQMGNEITIKYRELTRPHVQYRSSG